MAAPRMTIDQLPEDTVLSGTEWLIVQDGTTTKKMAASHVTAAGQAALDAHLNDAAAAHAATAISAAASSPTVNGADVQGQLGQLATETTTANTTANTAATDIAAHVGATSAAHNASAIAASGITGITATDVQGVLAELAARVIALEAV